VTVAGLKVGVTLFIRDGRQSLWENGLHQNALFLLMLLARSPLVGQCLVVNGGPGTGGIAAQTGHPVIDWAEAMTALDLVIELGAQVPADWAAPFRARGGRIIAMRAANDWVIDMESIAHGRPPGQLVSGVTYDQVWTLPGFARTCAAYYAHLLRAPVRIMPHLWSPALIEAAAPDWGYRPGGGRWRIAVLEPNISTVKTSHIPLLICELVHRARPGLLAQVLVCNADRFGKAGHFAQFAASLDIVRHGVARFAPRYPTATVLRGQTAIVSHHYENAQNYLHYEALHGGYPLIHNSDQLSDFGYRYDDCDEGAVALIDAITHHNADLETYRAKARNFIRTLDPCDKENIACYSAAIADCLNEP
jgi:hypothetical protein